MSQPIVRLPNGHYAPNMGSSSIAHNTSPVPMINMPAPTSNSTASASPSFDLEVIQQPLQARAMGWGSKADSRRPVDPPPVISFNIRNCYNENVTHMVTSSFILHVSLREIDPTTGSCTNSNMTNRLTGTTMASLTHVRNPSPGKFYFLLHDLSIRQEGRYQLVFNVYEVMSQQATIKHRAQTVSNVFTVYSPKSFPGLETSSDLIKQIASQGCRVRVRKESTFKRKKHIRSMSQNIQNSGTLPANWGNWNFNYHPSASSTSSANSTSSSSHPSAYVPAPMEQSYSDTTPSYYPEPLRQSYSDYSYRTQYDSSSALSMTPLSSASGGPPGPINMDYSQTFPPTPSYERERIMASHPPPRGAQRSLSFPNAMYSSPFAVPVRPSDTMTAGPPSIAESDADTVPVATSTAITGATGTPGQSMAPLPPPAPPAAAGHSRTMSAIVPGYDYTLYYDYRQPLPTDTTRSTGDYEC